MREGRGGDIIISKINNKKFGIKDSWILSGVAVHAFGLCAAEVEASISSRVPGQPRST